MVDLNNLRAHLQRFHYAQSFAIWQDIPFRPTSGMNDLSNCSIARTWILIALSGQLGLQPQIIDQYSMITQSCEAELFRVVGKPSSRVILNPDSNVRRRKRRRTVSRLRQVICFSFAKAFMDKQFHVSLETSPRVLSS